MTGVRFLFRVTLRRHDLAGSSILSEVDDTSPIVSPFRTAASLQPTTPALRSAGRTIASSPVAGAR
jgi:hypothetical protein